MFHPRFPHLKEAATDGLGTAHLVEAVRPEAVDQAVRPEAVDQAVAEAAVAPGLLEALESCQRTLPSSRFSAH